MSKIYFFLFLSLLVSNVFGQSKIAITIDDVPNTRLYKFLGYKATLLDRLDSLNLPVAIFVNEGQLGKTDSKSKNEQLLRRWIAEPWITLGSHTFSHLRYSEVGFDRFATDVEKGEEIYIKMSESCHKNVEYFRFPYNDLGRDSLARNRIEEYLKKRGSVIAPFTVESSDWMFSALYEHHLNNNKFEDAKRVAKAYVKATLDYFQHFDSLSNELYGRKINHIYLCHDNRINADYIGVLVKELKERNFSFVSISEAMKDGVYSRKNNYWREWGISWVYRWMDDEAEIGVMMNSEPDIMPIYVEYQREVVGK